MVLPPALSFFFAAAVPWLFPIHFLTQRNSTPNFDSSIMQSVLGGTIQKAGEVLSHATSSNSKVEDMKSEIREPTSKNVLTTDYGVKSGNTDAWLSATSSERKGPQLLEDNFAREKVRWRVLCSVYGCMKQLPLLCYRMAGFILKINLN